MRAEIIPYEPDAVSTDEGIVIIASGVTSLDFTTLFNSTH